MKIIFKNKALNHKIEFAVMQVPDTCISSKSYGLEFFILYKL
jgi:hypothetical protein